MKLDETRFVNINVIDPSESDIFPWVASGSGSIGSSYSFSFPGTAEAGQYAFGYMATKNAGSADNIVTISGITASYALGTYLSQRTMGIGRLITSPYSRIDITIQPVIFYIQAGNIGSSYTVNVAAPTVTYDTSPEYAYIILGGNSSFYAPGTGNDAQGIADNNPAYPTLSTNSFSYQSKYPAIRVIASAGYPSACTSENLATESFLSVGYDTLSGGSSALTRTVSQTLNFLMVQMMTPQVFVN